MTYLNVILHFAQDRLQYHTPGVRLHIQSKLELVSLSSIIV